MSTLDPNEICGANVPVVPYFSKAEALSYSQRN